MSKTRLFSAIKALDVEAVSALLDDHPELSRVTDERHRNPLHFLCGLPASDKTSSRSLALARLLLDRGLGVNEPAFVEAPSRPRRSGTRSPAGATCPWRSSSCSAAPRLSIASGRRAFTTTWRPSISS